MIRVDPAALFKSDSPHTYTDPKYVLPNDRPEQDRLNFQHQCLLVTFGHDLGYAPPNKHDEPGTRVLDVGTGTGIWAIDYAQRHPHHEVIGVDISAIQPDEVPANVTWKVTDLDDPWSYEKPFNYIHGRFLNGSVANYEKFLTDIYSNLAPGGWFEIQNIDCHTKSDDNTLLPSHPMRRAMDLLVEGTRKLGRPFIETPTIVPILEKIGFKNVRLQIFKWPINEWLEDPHLKELGRLCRLNVGGGIRGLVMESCVRGCGMEKSEIEALCRQTDEVLKKDFSQHGYFPIVVITAQKLE